MNFYCLLNNSNFACVQFPNHDFLTCFFDRFPHETMKVCMFKFGNVEIWKAWKFRNLESLKLATYPLKLPAYSRHQNWW